MTCIFRRYLVKRWRTRGWVFNRRKKISNSLLAPVRTELAFFIHLLYQAWSEWAGKWFNAGTLPWIGRPAEPQRGCGIPCSLFLIPGSVFLSPDPTAWSTQLFQ